MSEVSPKQLEANRENGKLGGVKTEEGKAVSRYNALRHGLLSQEVLLEDEDEEALLELEKRLRSELRPSTGIEMLLVDRIAANIWRLKRALKMEQEMIGDELKSTLFQSGSKKKTVGNVFTSYDFKNNDLFGKFLRYETSIERGIYKALHELQRIQAAHAGEKPPAPIAIDIDVSED